MPDPEQYIPSMTNSSTVGIETVTVQIDIIIAMIILLACSIRSLMERCYAEMCETSGSNNELASRIAEKKLNNINNNKGRASCAAVSRTLSRRLA